MRAHDTNRPNICSNDILSNVLEPHRVSTASTHKKQFAVAPRISTHGALLATRTPTQQLRHAKVPTIISANEAVVVEIQEDGLRNRIYRWRRHCTRKRPNAGLTYVCCGHGARTYTEQDKPAPQPGHETCARRRTHMCCVHSVGA